LVDVAFVVLLVLVTFLCLRPSSFIIELPWFPRSVAEWSDGSRHLPHTVAFFVLAVTGFAARLPVRWFRPSLSATRSLIANTAILLALAVALEIPQIWLDERTFSVLDILAGWGGVIAAGGVWAALSRWRVRESESEE